MNERHLRGVVIMALGVFILSPDALLIRLLETDTWTTLFWRGALTALAVGGFYVLRFQRGCLARFMAIGRWGIFVACFQAMGTILFVNSINTTTVANTLIIISTAPVYGAIFGWIFLKEPVARRTWFAIVGCLTGIFIIFGQSLGGGTLIGDLFALGAAGCMAANFIILRHARGIDMVPAVALGGVFFALLTFPLATPASASLSDAFYLGLAGLAMLPVSMTLLTIGVRYLPVAEASLFMLLETVLGPIWVWLVFRETPSLATFIGGVVVLTTLALHSVAGLREHQPGSLGRRSQ